LQQAEHNNTFISALRTVIAYRENRENSDLSITQNFSFILSYYLLLLIIFSIIFLGAVVFIAPSFADLFDGFGTELPALTKLFFNLNHPLFLILFALFIIGLFYLLVRQSALQGVIKHFPFLSKLYQQLAIIENLNSLAFLLKNGYSLNEALMTLADLGKTKKAQQQLQQAATQAENQQALTALKGFVPEGVLDLLAVSKSTQGLPTLLERLARLKAKQLQHSSMITSRILMLILSFAFGFLLLLFVVSVYLPIFQMGSMI
jgi:type IV pilus assembly protein PilC